MNELPSHAIDFLEVTGSYRIFKGVSDPILTQYGFGDYSDKGANVKLSLFRPEDSNYSIPGLAVGMEDFMGTSSFEAYYIVLTQVLLDYDLEISLGYGAKRIRGLFGGVNWMPFRRLDTIFNDLSLVCEYDAIPYKDKKVEKHPKGRKSNCRFNFGLKYHCFDVFDLSLSYIRGLEFAMNLSATYNFGETQGLIPKFDDQPLYESPVNLEPIGQLRPLDLFTQELAITLLEQGIELIESNICPDKERLSLKVVNLAYRQESVFKERLLAVLAAIVPENIVQVTVVVNAFLVDVQQYDFSMKYVRKLQNKEISFYEFNLLSPLKEVSKSCCETVVENYKVKKPGINLELMPRIQSLFGSSKGKFKYALGLSMAVNGFLPNDIFYSIQVGKFFLSSFDHINDVDRLNPSQLLNVRTDLIRYLQQEGLMLDEAYLEKAWNLGQGFYSRLSVGYFEIAYAGVGAEWLYFPVNSNWAVGVDAAVLKKRAYEGFSLVSEVRKLDGYKPHWKKFVGSQCFLNIYYNLFEADIELKLSLGKFLANDVGSRVEVARYFPSGLKVGFWYTMTNGHDVINDQTYYDKGVFFSVPLDIFYSRSSLSRWGYGMSAWLRDVGAKALAGNELYDIIYQQRF